MTTDPIKALEDAPALALRAADAVYRHGCTDSDECCHHRAGFVDAIRAAVDAVTPSLAALHGPDDAQKLFMYSIHAQRDIGGVLSRALTEYSGEDISWSSDDAARLAARAIRDLCKERDERAAELVRLREEVAELRAYRDEREAAAAARPALREELIGCGHPAWPDSLGFNYGDGQHANAARWLDEHRESQPQITVKRRYLSQWEVIDPTTSTEPTPGDDQPPAS